MAAVAKLQGNRDIEPCVPAMLSCVVRPLEVPDAIAKLSGTTFVQVNAARDDLGGSVTHACTCGQAQPPGQHASPGRTPHPGQRRQAHRTAQQRVTRAGRGARAQAVEAPALALMVPLLIRGLRHNDTPTNRKTAVVIANMSKLVNNPADATVFLPRLLPGLKVSDWCVRARCARCGA